MAISAAFARPFELGAQCFRLTPRGRACVDLAKAECEPLELLSRYEQDVLLLCGAGAGYRQMQQFMPPRSLQQSLRALLDLGLIATRPVG